jgi:signal transduction histidine kinase
MLVGEEGPRVRSAVVAAVGQLTRHVNRFNQIYAPPGSEAGPLVLGELLEELVELQGLQRALPSVEVDLQMASGLPAVLGIAGELRHLLLSLMVNAKQAIGKDGAGRIAVTAQSGAAGIVVVLEDNGGGVSAEARSRAFEPFFTTRAGSLGLGLPVARRLAERSGGSLTLESAPQGTRAVLTLAAWRRGG